MSKLLFIGDLFYDYDYISEDIINLSKWIKDNKYKTIVNLEGCINLQEGVPIEKRGPNLSNNVKVVEILKKLNVVAVCLANNHIMDFGATGLEDTIRLLESNGIKYFGAGKNIKEALQPLILELDKRKICIFGFGWNIEETVYATENSAGCAPRCEDIILSSISDAKKLVDDIVVCLHWGFEYNRLPMPYDINLAHNIIKSGAELIIGHHPHCVQPKEVFCGKSIYYSLGNFYFAGKRKDYKKKFNEKIQNQSDYGVMVIYDTLSKNSTEELIQYNRKKDESIRCGLNNELILEKKGVIDYKSRGYLKEVNKRKVNLNPILTVDEEKNKLALKKLFAKYRFKAIVKRLLKGR